VVEGVWHPVKFSEARGETNAEAEFVCESSMSPSTHVRSTLYNPPTTPNKHSSPHSLTILQILRVGKTSGIKLDPPQELTDDCRFSIRSTVLP
jgi:hypothetical protein